MLSAISPYVGFTAAGLVLVILAVDRHLQASRARALAVRIAVGGPNARSHQADITQRLPVIVMGSSGPAHATPPLPPAAFRRLPVPPQPPARRPDRPADPRGEARLMTPWGDLTWLPGSEQPGIVPSTLAAVPGELLARQVAPVDGEQGVLLGR